MGGHHQRWKDTTGDKNTLPNVERHYQIWTDITRGGRALQEVEWHYRRWKDTTRDGMTLQEVERHYQRWKETTRSGRTPPKVEAHYQRWKDTTRGRKTLPTATSWHKSESYSFPTQLTFYDKSWLGRLRLSSLVSHCAHMFSQARTSSFQVIYKKRQEQKLSKIHLSIAGISLTHTMLKYLCLNHVDQMGFKIIMIALVCSFRFICRHGRGP